MMCVLKIYKRKNRQMTNYNGGNSCSFILWEISCSYSLVLLVLLEGGADTNKYKVILTDHRYAMPIILMGVLSLEDDSAHIHRARKLTGWFNEYKNDVNNMLWPLELLVLNIILYHLHQIAQWGNMFWKNGCVQNGVQCQGALRLFWCLLFEFLYNI